jgi:hypothetical protein
MVEGVLTGSASRAVAFGRTPDGEELRVATSADLRAVGVTRSALVANLSARRWQRRGRAIVLHTGPLSRLEWSQVALLNCGPRSVLTAFTAAEFAGLKNWKRDAIHILCPGGVAQPAVPGLIVRLHRTATWPVEREPIKRVPVERWPEQESVEPWAERGSVKRWPDRGVGGHIQKLGPALIVAAGSFESPRPACGILAAAVQQQLMSAAELTKALDAAPRVRHRAALVTAVADIAGGSQALSEIDFVRLCRRNGLPEPIRQQVRRDSSGRRRYLDASWRRSDGRLVVAEVDGAIHLCAQRWWDDQQRQNELALAEALVLRFPSVVLRTDERSVVEQLRRALGIPAT